MQELTDFLDSKYPTDIVLEMLDNEMFHWVQEDWEENYLSEYLYYIEFNNGEAEDMVVFTIKKEVEKQIVSIWAGSGLAAEPTKRIKELLEENIKLKEQLSKIITNKI